MAYFNSFFGSRTGWQRGALAGVLVLGLTLAFAFALGVAPASAGTGIGTTVTLPSPVTVGDTGLSASVQFVNTSTAPDNVDTVTISNVTLSTVAGNSGVFALSGSGTEHAGTSCGSANFTITPAGAGQWTVSPNVVLQPVGANGTCVIDFTIDVLSFPAVDESGSAGTQARLSVAGNAENDVTGTPGNAAGTGQTTVNKATSRVTTEVHDNAHVDVTNTVVSAGTEIHDQATVAGTDGIDPTGTVDFELFDNGSCEGQAIDSDLGVALSGGVAESKSSTPGVGSYGYLTFYGGDENYNGSEGVCEPFTVASPLIVEKTVETSYDRDWDWTIEKTGATTTLLLAEGESYTVDYEVTVTPTSEDINHEVTGTITVTNPIGNPDAEVTAVDDVLDVSGAASVSCEDEDSDTAAPWTLSGGEVLTCTYEQLNADPTDSENTATVTTSGDVPGDEDTQPVSFGDPANETDECATVNDTNPNGPQGVVICEGDADKTIEYSVTFGPDQDGTDVILECGEIDHPNIADFITNDNQEVGDDDWSVHILVECETGCTLTQGYWKTHNDSFHGGAPTDDNWETIVLDGEETLFSDTNISWFDLFWTPPKGNSWYNLVHQYMAAVLNVNNGAAVPTEVQDALDEAETLLTQANLEALNVKGKAKKDVKELSSNMVGLAGILGSYNEGLIGPGHCDEQNPDEPIPPPDQDPV